MNGVFFVQKISKKAVIHYIIFSLAFIASSVWLSFAISSSKTFLYTFRIARDKYFTIQGAFKNQSWKTVLENHCIKIHFTFFLLWNTNVVEIYIKNILAWQELIANGYLLLVINFSIRKFNIDYTCFSDKDFDLTLSTDKSLHLIHHI